MAPAVAPSIRQAIRAQNSRLGEFESLPPARTLNRGADCNEIEPFGGPGS
jgi:hypothetical protein